jgi:hypothetical protein
MRSATNPTPDEVRRATLRKWMLRAIAEFHQHSEMTLPSLSVTQRTRLAYVAGFEAASCLDLLGGFLAAW